MSKKEKEVVRVKIYNKGRRTWPLKDNKEDVVCGPQRFIELNEDHAEKLMKAYPRDFVMGDKVQKAPSIKKLEADNKKLSGAVGTLTEDKTKLEEDNEALKKEIAELRAAKEAK